MILLNPVLQAPQSHLHLSPTTELSLQEISASVSANGQKANAVWGGW